ncbi:MAG: ATP-binding protein [Spirochaetales bacterium]
MNAEVERHFQLLELFRELPADDLGKFLLECREERLDSGTIIFREGDQPDRFYVLLEGQVEIWKDYGSTFADILAIRGPGASFGEMSLIDELPRSATARTASSALLLSLEKPRFRQIIEENPPIALLIMKTVSKMVRVSNEAFQYGLRQKNLMLERAYEDLKKAQDDLIRNERLSTLGKFASMIIHDLRNPISIVKGYSEILSLGSQSPEKTASMVGKLLGEIDRLNRMVGELLDYSRGNIRLNLSPVSLEEIFQRLQEQYQVSFRARSINLAISNSFHGQLLLDYDRILRVFANLIDNARKAMRHGGELSLTAAEEGDYVRISVADTGEGMPEEVQKNLFEPFFSASSSGGTGLGMVVVANVVEAHQGTIEVHSVLHKGTTISFRVPSNPRSFGS